MTYRCLTTYKTALFLSLNNTWCLFSHLHFWEFLLPIVQLFTESQGNYFSGLGDHENCVLRSFFFFFTNPQLQDFISQSLQGKIRRATTGCVCGSSVPLILLFSNILSSVVASTRDILQSILLHVGHHNLASPPVHGCMHPACSAAAGYVGAIPILSLGGSNLGVRPPCKSLGGARLEDCNGVSTWNRWRSPAARSCAPLNQDDPGTRHSAPNFAVKCIGGKEAGADPEPFFLSWSQETLETRSCRDTPTPGARTRPPGSSPRTAPHSGHPRECGVGCMEPESGGILSLPDTPKPQPGSSGPSDRHAPSPASTFPTSCPREGDGEARSECPRAGSGPSFCFCFFFWKKKKKRDAHAVNGVA